MSAEGFERAFPQGDPEAVFCRWCGLGRVRFGNALGCKTCDLTERL